VDPRCRILVVYTLLVGVLGCRQGDVAIVVGGKADPDSGAVDADDGAPVDSDDDGHDSVSDCDDGDPTIYPGAPEVAADGVDQDCDGVDSLTEYGFRDDEDTTVLVENYIIGNQVVLDAPLVVTHLGMLQRSETSAQVRMALYEDDGGRPAALVAQTGDHTPGLGVNELALEAPVELGAGDVWVMIVAEGAVEIGAGPDELVVYRELDYAAGMPDPFGSSTDYEGPRISVFVSGELPDG